MVFDVDINGRSWRVTIERAARDGQFFATVEGRRRIVDLVRIDPGTVSLIVMDEQVDGDTGRLGPPAVHEIGIVAGHRLGELTISAHGKAFTATLASQPGRSRDRRRSSDAPAVTTGRQAIVAPMPGRIVRVLVAPGDLVSARQGMIVVEAMKMENELRSPKDGVVREVTAREGASVEAGAVLAVVE